MAGYSQRVAKRGLLKGLGDLDVYGLNEFRYGNLSFL